MVNRVPALQDDEIMDEGSTEGVNETIRIDQPEDVHITIENDYPDDHGFYKDFINLEDTADCETHTLSEHAPQEIIEPPPSQPSRQVEDVIEEVIHIVKTPQLSVFITALTICEEQQSVTREGHRQLVEILQLVNSLEELSPPLKRYTKT